LPCSFFIGCVFFFLSCLFLPFHLLFVPASCCRAPPNNRLFSRTESLNFPGCPFPLSFLILSFLPPNHKMIRHPFSPPPPHNSHVFRSPVSVSPLSPPLLNRFTPVLSCLRSAGPRLRPFLSFFFLLLTFFPSREVAYVFSLVFFGCPVFSERIHKYPPTPWEPPSAYTVPVCPRPSFKFLILPPLLPLSLLLARFVFFNPIVPLHFSCL